MYIFLGAGEKQPRISEIKNVSPTRKYVVTGYVNLPGIGKAPTKEWNGECNDESFEVRTTGGYYTVDKKKIGEKMRVVTDKDKEELEKISQEIQKLMRKKVEVIARAWKNARPVTVEELEKLMEEMK